MRAIVAFVGACVLLLGHGSPLVGQQDPPRDAREASGQFTGAIAGRVTVADTGEPIRWATVSVTAAERRTNLSTSTDADGRYRFDALPPGSYTLQAGKAGFVSMPFGARRYRDPATPIPVEATPVAADLGLPRAGAIEGRVLGPSGDPAQDVTLQALRVAYDAAGRRAVPVGYSSRSDDRGRFRIHSLPPGHYIVQASPLSSRMASDAPNETASLRTYYPGTTRLTDAQLVHASSARTASIGLSIVAGVASTLTTTVIDSQGRVPHRSTATLRSIGGGAIAAMVLPASRNVFGFSNVQDDEYLLVVTARTDGSEIEFATRRITVAGRNVTEPPIRTMPGISLEGAIEIESAGRAPRLDFLSVIAHNTAFPGLVDDVNGPPRPPARIGADGRFAFTSLIGPRLFRVAADAPWALKSVRLDDRDVTDAPVDVHSTRDTRSLRIVVTDRTGDIAGSVRVTDDTRPVDQRLQVVVFDEDERQWVFESRFTRVANVDRDGHFALRGLLPGRYLAVLAGDLEPGSWADPDVLRQLRPSGVAVDVAEGKTTSVSFETGAVR